MSAGMRPARSDPSERLLRILGEPRGGDRAEPSPPDDPPRVLTVPRHLREGRLDVRGRAIAGFAVVALIALAVLGVRFVLAQREGSAVPVTSDPVTQAGDRVAFASPSPGTVPATASAPSGPVVVHVVGQVKKPGVIELTAGARVDDAITAAGGATTKADLAQVNLARPALDGEQIIVPKRGEAPGPPGTPAAGMSGEGPAAPGQLIDLNTADQASLETLPGVGPVLAQRIIEWRTEHGRFNSVEDLNSVSGIGEKIFAQLAPKVRV